MNDFVGYMSNDPYFRGAHHNELTFSMVYAYSERFMLGAYPMMKWYTRKDRCWRRCLEPRIKSSQICVRRMAFYDTSG